jgi:hypothetical protein
VLPPLRLVRLHDFDQLTALRRWPRVGWQHTPLVFSPAGDIQALGTVERGVGRHHDYWVPEQFQGGFGLWSQASLSFHERTTGRHIHDGHQRTELDTCGTQIRSLVSGEPPVLPSIRREPVDEAVAHRWEPIGIGILVER